MKTHLRPLLLMKEGHDGLRGQTESLDALLEELLDHLAMEMW
jgi:hypothetical protein